MMVVRQQRELLSLAHEALPGSEGALRGAREYLGKLSVKQSHPSEVEHLREGYLVSQSCLVYG